MNNLNNKLKGKIIKEQREKKKWNQKKLSSISGISQPTISRIENGELKKPSYKTLSKIISSIGITPKYFEELFRIELINNKNQIKPKAFLEDHTTNIDELIDNILSKEIKLKILKYNENFNQMLFVKKSRLKKVSRYHTVSYFEKNEFSSEVLVHVKESIKSYFQYSLHRAKRDTEKRIIQKRNYFRGGKYPERTLEGEVWLQLHNYLSLELFTKFEKEELVERYLDYEEGENSYHNKCLWQIGDGTILKNLLVCKLAYLLRKSRFSVDENNTRAEIDWDLICLIVNRIYDVQNYVFNEITTESTYILKEEIGEAHSGWYFEISNTNTKKDNLVSIFSKARQKLQMYIEHNARNSAIVNMDIEIGLKPLSMIYNLNILKEIKEDE